MYSIKEIKKIRKPPKYGREGECKIHPAVEDTSRSWAESRRQVNSPLDKKREKKLALKSLKNTIEDIDEG